MFFNIFSHFLLGIFSFIVMKFQVDSAIILLIVVELTQAETVAFRSGLPGKIFPTWSKDAFFRFLLSWDTLIDLVSGIVGISLLKIIL